MVDINKKTVSHMYCIPSSHSFNKQACKQAVIMYKCVFDGCDLYSNRSSRHFATKNSVNYRDMRCFLVDRDKSILSLLHLFLFC